MKRIFLDTNFIIDLVARPEYSAVAQNILEEGRRRKIKFFISFLSLANYAYIARKHRKSEVFENLTLLCDIFEVIPNHKKQIEFSIGLGPEDFEDAIQYSTAVEAKCECIITRNKPDFLEFSKIPVFTPAEFADILFNKPDK